MKKTLLFLALTLATLPTFSQNLTGKILFSVTNGGRDSIYALNRDGRTLTYVAEGFRPRLSHNGKILAFSRNVASPGNNLGADLWIRFLDTGHDTMIYDGRDYTDYYDFT